MNNHEWKCMMVYAKMRTVKNTEKHDIRNAGHNENKNETIISDNTTYLIKNNLKILIKLQENKTCIIKHLWIMYKVIIILVNIKQYYLCNGWHIINSARFMVVDLQKLKSVTNFDLMLFIYG